MTHWTIISTESHRVKFPIPNFWRNKQSISNMKIKTSCSHSLDTSCGPNAVWGLFRHFSKSHSDLWERVSKSLSHVSKILGWVGTETTPPSQICHSQGPLMETPVLPLCLLVESSAWELGIKCRMTLGCPRPRILFAFVGRNELLTHAPCEIFTRYVANQVFSFPQLRNNAGGVGANTVDVTLHYLDSTINTSNGNV